ncbi:MAG TPA: DUF721 domain-containing protein [Gaiellaceae bacterium]|nr:DUF721 domain-containing protein [Gaiellaceae bacterium]
MDRLDRQIRRELGRFGPVDGDMVGIARAWPEAVGPTVAKNAWPARLARDGTLHVNAVSSTWAFELGRLAATILDQLRPALGEATPAGLKFAPGPVPEPEPESAEERGPPRPEPEPEHRAEGARLAAAIEDEELRGIVARAAAASLARAAEQPPADRRF